MVVAVLINTSGLCLGWQGKGPKKSFCFKDRLGKQRTQEMTRWFWRGWDLVLPISLDMSTIFIPDLSS